MTDTTALQAEAKSTLSDLAWLLVFTPPVCLIRSWVLMTLWNWYCVPGFSAPPLQMIYAFGIIVIASFLTPTRKREDMSVARIVTLAIGGALMSLLFGWVGTFFM